MTQARAETDPAALLVTPEGIRDPFPVYRRLRRTAPVHWSDTMRAWLVTGYHEVREVYRSYDRFSSVGKASHNIYRLPDEVRRAIPTVELVETHPALSSADPPLHTRQRAAVIRPLAPRGIAEQRAWVEAVCDELAASLAQMDDPDLIRDFSFELAYRVILGLFGAPLDHVARYQEATDARIAFTTVADPGPDVALRYERAVVALRDAIEGIYPEAAASGEGIIASLLNPARPEDELERDELFVLLKVFFAAGQENLVYSIPTAIHLLLSNPDQLELLHESPGLAEAAFEEAVRYDTPVPANPRKVRADVEFGGRLLCAGDLVLNVKGSANRDEAVWTDPDRFLITRDQHEPEGGSVAFGQGPHFCAGAGIARLAGSTAIRTLVTRFPDMHLPASFVPRWLNAPMNRKLRELPVVLR